jgi:hypothetical protein
LTSQRKHINALPNPETSVSTWNRYCTRPSLLDHLIWLYLSNVLTMLIVTCSLILYTILDAILSGKADFQTSLPGRYPRLSARQSQALRGNALRPNNDKHSVISVNPLVIQFTFTFFFKIVLCQFRKQL